MDTSLARSSPESSLTAVSISNLTFTERFLLLFNLLFDEKMSLPFTDSPDPSAKIMNWNKINAMICFNYLQQAFYLGASTMKVLSQGSSANTLFHIIKLLISESQYNFDEEVVKEAEAADISTVMMTDASHAGFDEQVVFSEGDTLNDPSGKSTALTLQ